MMPAPELAVGRPRRPALDLAHLAGRELEHELVGAGLEQVGEVRRVGLLRVGELAERAEAHVQREVDALHAVDARVEQPGDVGGGVRIVRGVAGRRRLVELDPPAPGRSQPADLVVERGHEGLGQLRAVAVVLDGPDERRQRERAGQRHLDLAVGARPLAYANSSTAPMPSRHADRPRGLLHRPHVERHRPHLAQRPGIRRPVMREAKAHTKLARRISPSLMTSSPASSWSAIARSTASSNVSATSVGPKRSPPSAPSPRRTTTDGRSSRPLSSAAAAGRGHRRTVARSRRRRAREHAMPVLTSAQVIELARSHREARQRAEAIGQPTLAHPGMDVDDAYAVQRAWIELELAGGRHVVGHKVGLTSQAMQAQMQIGEPDFGTLLDDMVVDDGADLDRSRFIDPRIEVEVAFVLGRPLDGPTVSAFDVLDATEYVTPALELIDARSHRVDPATGRARTVRDTIADNAANAGIVTGGRAMRPARRRPPLGRGAAVAATASSRRRASPPACSSTRPTPWPGWPGR